MPKIALIQQSIPINTLKITSLLLFSRQMFDKKTLRLSLLSLLIHQDVEINIKSSILARSDLKIIVVKEGPSCYWIDSGVVLPRHRHSSASIARTHARPRGHHTRPPLATTSPLARITNHHRHTPSITTKLKYDVA